MHLLKKTLQKCETNGWLEQISGKGFSGTYQLCFPYNPSPGVLFPKKESDGSEDEDEGEDESSEDSEDEELPPKRSLEKRTPAKSQGKTASMKQGGSKPTQKVPAAQRGKVRPLPKKAPPKAKTPARKARPSVIKKPSESSSKEPIVKARKETKLPGKGKSAMKKSFKTKK